MLLYQTIASPAKSFTAELNKSWSETLRDFANSRSRSKKVKTFFASPLNFIGQSERGVEFETYVTTGAGTLITGGKFCEKLGALVELSEVFEDLSNKSDCYFKIVA